MKIAIFLSLIALASCGILNSRTSTTDVVQIIQSHGYKVETYEVVTSDGYILQLFRMPRGGLRSKTDSSESEEQTRSPTEPRPVALLVHGLLSNSIDFVIGGPSEGLAFVLNNQGYDVYLANVRGTVYGQKHTTLNPKKDAAFWRFCWHQIGVKDLPAIVDKVLSVSGERQISYVGHMEGSTALYVLASELPEYNQKFNNVVALGPIAFMQHAENEIINKIVSHRTESSWIIKHLGISTINPSTELLSEVETKCTNEHIAERICRNPYFLFNGYNSRHLNETTIDRLINVVPSTSSVKEVLHFVQLKKSGRFELFDSTNSNSEVREYDLSKVTVPVSVLYTPQDKLSNVEDVKLLVQKLPNVYEHEFTELTNNLDLLFSKNVREVYDVVIRRLNHQQ